MPVLNNAKRVLIYRLGSLGDTIVALPSFHLIARAFPNAERRLLTNIPITSKAPAAAAVLGDSGLVHGYLNYTVGERNLENLLQLRREIRAWQPDALIYLAGYRGMPALLRDWLFFRACGINRLYGFPFSREMQEAQIDPATGEYEYAASWVAHPLINQLGNARLADPASWDLNLSPDEIATAADALDIASHRPIIAVCVGTKVQAKDWGVDNWHALIAELTELYHNYALVMIGAAEEREVSDQAAEVWRKRAVGSSVYINLCGQLTPRESAVVLARAKLYIGVDSGPMHLAAAVGTRCLAIFAARTMPRVWFPYSPIGTTSDDQAHRVIYHQVDCANCKLDTCIVQQKKCILSITVQETLAAITEMLPPPAI